MAQPMPWFSLLRQEGGGHTANEAGGTVLVGWRVGAILGKSPWAGQMPQMGYENNSSNDKEN